MSRIETATEPRQGLSIREPWTAYAAWAADTLGMRLSFDGDHYRLETERDEQAATASDSRAGRSWLRRARPKPPAESDVAPVEAGTPSEALRAIMQRLAALPEPPAACPRHQPTAVHEIAQPLMAAYQLDGGAVHVAGCRLEDRPIYRVTSCQQGDQGDPLVEHRYYSDGGEAIPTEWITQVGAHRVGPLSPEASRAEHGVEASGPDRALAAAAAEGVSGELSVAVVWVKYTSGTLRFEFGDESLDTPFEGWAATLTAPAATCPITGAKTFHLATVEGGAICAAEQIGVCSVTGHRRPLPELVRCSESGQLAERDVVETCALTGKPVIANLLKRCPRCGESVGATVMKDDLCAACRKPTRLSTSDPRIQKIVAARTSMARRRWSASETRNALVLESTSWFRRRVVTFDRETLEAKHAAEASRFSPVWRRLPLDEL